jgi:hypothetical protein
MQAAFVHLLSRVSDKGPPLEEVKLGRRNLKDTGFTRGRFHPG